MVSRIKGVSYRLRMFENVVLGRIFVCKRGETTGSGRKLHNDDHRNFYYSPDVVKMIESEIK